MGDGAVTRNIPGRKTIAVLEVSSGESLNYRRRKYTGERRVSPFINGNKTLKEVKL